MSATLVPTPIEIAEAWQWLMDHGVEDPPADYRIERALAGALDVHRVTSTADHQGMHEAFADALRWLGFSHLVDGVL